MVTSRYIGDKLIPPLIGNPYNGYINPYYWVDDHPLLYGNNGSLDPGTYGDRSLRTNFERDRLAYHFWNYMKVSLVEVGLRNLMFAKSQAPETQ